MAKIGVSLKVNLDAIEAARVFKGQKGSYLDATVFIDLDELDQYGNSGMITQDVKKEEKAQGVKGAILGNCKVFWGEGVQVPQASQQSPQQGGGWNSAPQTPAPQTPAQSWGDPWIGLKPSGAAAHLTIEQIKADPSIQGNAQAALGFGWVIK